MIIEPEFTKLIEVYCQQYSVKRLNYLLSGIRVLDKDSKELILSLNPEGKQTIFRMFDKGDLSILASVAVAVNLPYGKQIPRKYLKKISSRRAFKIAELLGMKNDFEALDWHRSDTAWKYFLISERIFELEYGHSLINQAKSYSRENNLREVDFIKVLEAARYSQNEGAPIEWVIASGLIDL